MRYILLLAIAALMAGCGAQTTGKDITVKNEFTFGDVYAPVTISPGLSTESGDNKLDVVAPTEIKTDGELILTPSAQLDKAVQSVSSAAIIAKATELEAGIPETPGKYQTKFHHTSTGASHGGKSLTLCPGQVMNFDKCTANIVNIPRHNIKEGDEGREMYWNQTKAAVGDIVCTLNGKEYRYKADKKMVYGKCK